MKLREFTTDYIIKKSVVDENEYQLSECTLPENCLILDLGAHIGTFALKVSEFYNKNPNLFCFEPDKDNFDVLRENCEHLPISITLNNTAVWRSDTEETHITFAAYEMWSDNKLFKNFAAGKVVKNNFCTEETVKVKCVSLDSVIYDLTTQFNRAIDILKIDIEGSEFPVLYTSKMLGRVNSIYMEIHSGDGPKDQQWYLDREHFCVNTYTDYTITGMCNFLFAKGFYLENKTFRGGENLFIFKRHS